MSTWTTKDMDYQIHVKCYRPKIQLLQISAMIFKGVPIKFCAIIIKFKQQKSHFEKKTSSHNVIAKSGGLKVTCLLRQGTLKTHTRNNNI